MFLRRLTLGRPGVDARNLVLERRVNKPVSLQRVETLELRRHDQRRERLAAAACVLCFCQLLAGREEERKLECDGGVRRGNGPDMSVTSTCVDCRRWLMAERRLSSVICAMVFGELFGGERSARAEGGGRVGGRFVRGEGDEID